MKNKIKSFLLWISGLLSQIRSWVKAMPDTWAIPITLVLFWGSMHFLRWLDPTSGIFDIGLFQIIVVIAALLTSINFLVFLGIEFNFPVIWKWYKNDGMKSDWKLLTPWQHFIFFWLLYFPLLLFAGILVLAMT